MANRGKRYKAAAKPINRESAYPLAEAVKLLKQGAKAKFDETVEIALNLGIDPRHADQQVRGVVELPNGTGKSLRVGVFARGDKAEAAKAAGADVVGAEEVVDYTRRENVAERLAKKFGASVGAGAVSSMRSMVPSMR